MEYMGIIVVKSYFINRYTNNATCIAFSVKVAFSTFRKAIE